jgi:predicted dehydrogenase
MAQKSVSTAMEAPKKAYKGKKLRVAIIGCGGIAQTHLHNFKNIPEVEVVAGVDVDIERLKIMRDTWGIPEDCLFGASFKTGKTTSQTGWVEMLKKMGDRIDAVDVCTPNGWHCKPVVDACNAGKHAIVEKPMAMNPAECEKMIQAAKKSKVKLSVGFQHRYRPGMQALLEARDNGVFGDILFVKVQALRRRGIPNWGVFGQKEKQGGGPMIDIGVHMIEAAYEFMGCPKPVAASANCWTYMGNKKEATDVRCPWPGWDWKTYTVEDLAIGQIRFANGAIMQIESSFAAHVPEEKHCFSAIGTRAGCKWPDPVVYTDQNNTMVDITPHYLGDDGWDAMFTAKLKDWASGCLKGTELSASGEDGLNVQKILDGVYRSAAAGKEVAIK